MIFTVTDHWVERDVVVIALIFLPTALLSNFI